MNLGQAGGAQGFDHVAKGRLIRHGYAGIFDAAAEQLFLTILLGGRFAAAGKRNQLHIALMQLGGDALQCGCVFRSGVQRKQKGYVLRIHFPAPTGRYR